MDKNKIELGLASAMFAVGSLLPIIPSNKAEMIINPNTGREIKIQHQNKLSK